MPSQMHCLGCSDLSSPPLHPSYQTFSPLPAYSCHQVTPWLLAYVQVEKSFKDEACGDPSASIQVAAESLPNLIRNTKREQKPYGVTAVLSKHKGEEVPH